MFGILGICEGLHCAGCKSVGPLAVIVGVLILCLTSVPTAIAILAHALIWAALIIAAGMVLTGISLVIATRYAQPRLMQVRGTGWVTMAPEAIYVPDYSAGLPQPQRRMVDSGYRRAILPRSAYEWQDEGQRVILPRRDETTRP